MIKNNVFNLWARQTQDGGYQGAFALYGAHETLFQDNTVCYSDSGANAGTRMIFNLRDYARWNKILRNTLQVTGTPARANDILCSNGGSYGLGNTWCSTNTDPAYPAGGDCDGQVAYNRWEGNTFKVNHVGNAVMRWENGARGDTVRFNSFYAGEDKPAVWIGRCDSLIFSHNLCWAANGQVAEIGYGYPTTAATRLVSNTFYGTETNASTVTVALGQYVTCDSLGILINYGAYPDSDRAVQVYPGTHHAPNTIAPSGHPGSATWFDPQLADPSYTAADARLLPYARAISTAMCDSFAGPVAATNPINGIASITGVSRNITTVPYSATISFHVPWGIRAYTAYLIPANYEPDDIAHGTAVTLPGPGSAYATQTITLSVPTDQDYWLAIETTNVFADVSVPTAIGISHTSGSRFFFPD